jgi:hypothetical protein
MAIRQLSYLFINSLQKLSPSVSCKQHNSTAWTQNIMSFSFSQEPKAQGTGGEVYGAFPVKLQRQFLDPS